MTQREEIERKIEKVKFLIYALLDANEALADPKLVVLSQKLDELLNQYNKLLD
ncbi:aspartyl-phosphate phosphatase Spo0E family protein [Clostridium psychrophilum]|uniref:aspartyl-phosphate phosphatase Spo0E family protein n=1 Tax=Clostridium psychrophilum TaxID=132926 RepID=UPI001C0AE543|nr:aspartyl-phosphate phosphatase Spo0E family protein [Clostridium psychrophilum]MBU3182755.1 aspartyl-phosphate phosphatase Spo0E family protein [Clostridium psychrophilum]